MEILPGFPSSLSHLSLFLAFKRHQNKPDLNVDWLLGFESLSLIRCLASRSKLNADSLADSEISSLIGGKFWRMRIFTVLLILMLFIYFGLYIYYFLACK